MDHSGANTRIGVIGLGYVGLPVAIACARNYPVTGYDIDQDRVAALRSGDDWTGEVDRSELEKSGITFTADPTALAECNFFIVTVPTPVDRNKSPDFGLLVSACKLLGPFLKRDDIVVFESTVYPGASEEICGPELEKASGLTCGTDFHIGYSPERINPGDRARPIEKIVKVVSAQNDETLDMIAAVYSSFVKAGVHKAPSIKVAEAAKVLENTQRDINIALMNEMSKICDRLGIRTIDVLQAAETKWNFLAFRPGLVGGHCIGVDPYYLTSKAEQLGYHPEVILAGRRINDGMAAHVASRLIQFLATANRPVHEAKVGILGLTFKENVPDIRNSKVVDLVRELTRYGILAAVHDPIADVNQARREYGIELTDKVDWEPLDALILAVPHEELMADRDGNVMNLLDQGGIFFDLKSTVSPANVRSDLIYWSL